MATNHPLRLWRKRNGLTLEALGARIGTAKSTVAAYELRLRFPRPGIVEAIERLTAGAVTASDLVAAYHLPDASPETNQASDTPPGRSSDRSRVLDRPGANSISNSG